MVPEGAVGEVEDDHYARWSLPDGPRLYPAEYVTSDFIRRREEDPAYEPAGFFDNQLDGLWVRDRVPYQHYFGEGI